MLPIWHCPPADQLGVHIHVADMDAPNHTAIAIMIHDNHPGFAIEGQIGESLPLASFLMPGNTADVTTLVPVVRRLKERFGIQRACIVAHRGMISAATIADLEAKGIDYETCARVVLDVPLCI